MWGKSALRVTNKPREAHTQIEWRDIIAKWHVLVQGY